MLVLQDLSPETNLLFRPIIIQQVLGTDMKKHFEILSRFQVSGWPYIWCKHNMCLIANVTILIQLQLCWFFAVSLP